MIQTVFKRIDLERLSGLTSVLGIDIDGDDAFVVELTRRGSVLSRYSGSFVSLRSLPVRFPGLRLQAKGEAPEGSLCLQWRTDALCRHISSHSWREDYSGNDSA